MKELAKCFKQQSFTLTQLLREGNKAIYKKNKKSFKYEVYEVVVITNHNGYTLADQYIEPAETYPSNSLWGIKGWTFNDLNKAKSFFKKLKPKT